MVFLIEIKYVGKHIKDRAIHFHITSSSSSPHLYVNELM